MSTRNKKSAARKFTDSDAPSLLRELLGSLSVQASHAVGPHEYLSEMERLNPDRFVGPTMPPSENEHEVTNDEALMITGKQLLRSLVAAAGDAFVLVEPRIGPPLSLSRLDFRSGNAHLLARLSAWRTACAKDLEYARRVVETVRRGILGPAGTGSPCSSIPRCRAVTYVGANARAILVDELEVLSVIVGPRAVAAVAGSFFGRPSLAEAAVNRTAKVAILYCNNKFLPAVDDLVTEDIARRWFVLEKEADDEMYGTCVVCYGPAELHRLDGTEKTSNNNARVCNRCSSRVCLSCTAKMREHLDLTACPVCKYRNS